MAKDKTSFILYSDLISVVKKLVLKDREEKTNNAGELFLHILEYVNDNEPIPINFIVDMSFEPIKLTLKRDLKKYEVYIEKQRENGSKGGRPRKTEKTQPFLQEPKKADSVSDSDSVNDIEKNKILNNSLLSEIKISDDKNFLLFKENKIEASKETIFYFKTAVSFQLLFIKNLKEKKSPTAQLELANFKNFVEPIRLMFEKDKITSIQIRQAYDFLNSKEGDFWKPNILSTKKLREKISVLLAKANTSVNPIKQNTFIPDPNKRKRIT
jgi:hypothetical protein